MESGSLGRRRRPSDGAVGESRKDSGGREMKNEKCGGAKRRVAREAGALITAGGAGQEASKYKARTCDTAGYGRAFASRASLLLPSLGRFWKSGFGRDVRVA
jgi:hypothetical protein